MARPQLCSSLPELFCSTPNMTDIPIITAITILVSSLSSGYIAALLLLFKELCTTFGKLMIIHNITSSLASLNVFILLITHYSIAVNSLMPCYLIYFMFMQSIIVSEGSATCIIAYLVYDMRQSCKSREVKKQHNKQFYKDSVNFLIGSLLLLDFLIISYDFGTATIQHVILPNGHCNYITRTTLKITQAYNTFHKIIQIILLVVYFVYNHKLIKMLKMVRTLSSKVDHQQN